MEAGRVFAFTDWGLSPDISGSDFGPPCALTLLAFKSQELIAAVAARHANLSRLRPIVGFL